MHEFVRPFRSGMSRAALAAFGLTALSAGPAHAATGDVAISGPVALIVAVLMLALATIFEIARTAARRPAPASHPPREHRAP